MRQTVVVLEHANLFRKQEQLINYCDAQSEPSGSVGY